MVDVTYRPYVDVGLRPLKFLLGHYKSSTCGAHKQIRTADLVLTKNALYLLSYVGPS